MEQALNSSHLRRAIQDRLEDVDEIVDREVLAGKIVRVGFPFSRFHFTCQDGTLHGALVSSEEARSTVVTVQRT